MQSNFVCFFNYFYCLVVFLYRDFENLEIRLVISVVHFPLLVSSLPDNFVREQYSKIVIETQLFFL